MCHQLSEHDTEDENIFMPTLPRMASPEPVGRDEERTLRGELSPDSKHPVSRKRRRRPLLPFHKDDIGPQPDHSARLMRTEEGVSIAPF